MSKQIHVSSVPVGGGADIAIQSMCNTRTEDVAATVAQILRLEEAGSDIIRVAVPDMAAAQAVGRIRRAIHIPLVADIHFDYKRALECVRKDFDYAFAQDKYRGVPEIELHEIDIARPFRVGDVEIVPVSGHHSERFEVTGFRIGPLAYLTDFKTIEDAEAEKLRGTEVLAVNALRFAPHPSHFNLAEALALIRRVGPREAYITHMSHEIGLHAETEATLPPGVHLAYDGLEVEI